jgi:WD40 repeat protein
MITTLALALTLFGGQSGSLSVKSVGVAEGLRPLAFAAAPTGSKFAATMEDDTVRIIDAKTRETVRVLKGLVQPAYAVAWSADGKRIATGDESARVILWDVASGKQLRTFRDHQRGIEAVAFNEAGTLLVSTGKDDAVCVYSLTSGKKLRTILGHGVNLYGALFIGKTSNLLMGTLGKGASIYSVEGQELVPLGGHGGQGALEAAMNPAQTLIVSAGKDGDATVWSAKSKKKLNSLHGHADWVVHVIFSPNGRYVATSSVDGTVRVWDPYSFRQVVGLQNQCRVASPLCFTTDGRYLITVNGSDFLQYNALTPPQPAGKQAAAKTHRRHRRHRD